MKALHKMLDVLLLAVFVLVAGIGVYYYFFHKPAKAPGKIQLDGNAPHLNLRELLTLCQDTPPLAIDPAWAPKKLSNRWEYVTIHHSATLGGSSAAFEKEHRREGMTNGLAYHFVITNGHGGSDGAVEVGRRWSEQLDGGHVKGDELNSKAIGICLVGDFTRHPPTAAQIASLKALLNFLLPLAQISESNVLPHKEMPGQATQCPGCLPVDEIVKHRKDGAVG